MATNKMIKLTPIVFVKKMKVGDIVLVAYQNEIYLAEITSDYQYDETKKDEGYPHIRSVKWIKKISRSQLPDKIRKSLHYPGTIADLTGYLEEIIAIIEGREIASKAKEEELFKVEYPLRLNQTVKIYIPRDISKQEAERLSDFVTTLYFRD